MHNAEFASQRISPLGAACDGSGGVDLSELDTYLGGLEVASQHSRRRDLVAQIVTDSSGPVCRRRTYRSLFTGRGFAALTLTTSGRLDP